MSDIIVPEVETSITPTEDTTSQNVDAQDKNKDKNVSMQQTARAIKAEAEAKELKERLAKYEQEEEVKRNKDLETKGQYETLIKEIEDKKVKYEEQIGNLGAYKEKYEGLLEQQVVQALGRIPEEQKELVIDLVSAYSGEEKIEKISKLANSFGIKPTSFGGVPDTKKPVIIDEFEILKAKINSGTVTTAENSRYQELKAKNI